MPRPLAPYQSDANERHRTRADRPEEMAGRDQAGRRLIVRHAAWRNTRRCLLDKTQSAAALFAVTNRLEPTYGFLLTADAHQMSAD